MQLSLNLDPIIKTKTELYKGWEIVANQRQKEKIIREGVTKLYQERYNQHWSEFKVDFYFETIIYRVGVARCICGENSGCKDFDIAIQCTKKYIDRFNS